MIGKKLYSLVKKSNFRKIELSPAPEFHYYDLPTFRPWIENLIGNIEGAKSRLLEYNLLKDEEIKEATEEVKGADTPMERDKAQQELTYWMGEKGEVEETEKELEDEEKDQIERAKLQEKTQKEQKED